MYCVGLIGWRGCWNCIINVLGCSSWCVQVLGQGLLTLAENLDMLIAGWNLGLWYRFVSQDGSL